MGFFDSKWIVEFEYSDSFIGSYKKATMVVEASSEYSAKDKAKAVLKANHKFVKVLSAHKSGGKSEERGTTYTPPRTVTTVRETPVHSEPVSSTVHHESFANTPLTNDGDSSVPNFFASSTASLIATGFGISSSYFIS